MDKIIKNKKCIAALIILLVAGMWIIWFSFFRINLEGVSQVWNMGMYWAEDEEHSLMMQAVLFHDAEEYYIMGTLVRTEYIEEGHQLVSDQNSRMIYWRRISEAEITSNDYIGWQDGIKDDNNLRINVIWIDNETVQIEDKVLDIKRDSYDYRRDLSMLFQH